MAYHRAILVALATLFTAGLTSMASACCGGSYAYTGCGGGGCGAPATVGYGRPFLFGWGNGCGGCGYYGYRAALVEPTYVARSPIYVVNQGPDYSGPGLMVPYPTWAPSAAYGPSFRYPYIRGYGYRHRYAYGYGYGWRARHYWRHPYH
jgi:hypothetical protein